jgi:hypothetical protein
VKLKDCDDNEVCVQYPLSVDGDSVYVKDIDLDTSTTTGFTGGTVEDLFNSLTTTLTNSTASNPKTIIINLNRIVSCTGISVGDTNGGTHSNIKIEALRGGDTYTTLRDNSTSAIAFNSRFYSISTTAGNDTISPVSVSGFKITFNTTNTIALSHITINKVQERQSSLIGLKDDGITTYIGATNNSNLKVSVQEYGDTPAIDAFDRLRTSEPFTIFDSKQLHDKQPLFWDESLGGSATSVHNSANASVEMDVTASASDFAIRQTKQRFNYQPGKGQLIFMTFYSPQATGATKRIGCFDGTSTNNLTPNNGIFFECDGTLSWNIAKNGSTTETVAQSSWNVDKLDGTGKSGITLDMASTQVLVIDFEWLGVGRVRVGFVIDGLIYYVHYFNHANNDTFTSVYMSTPNLPLRYDIQTDGSEATQLDHICSTVMSEGGLEQTGVLRSVDTGTTHVDADAANTIYAVVGIRLKATYKDVSVLPEFFSMINEQSQDFRWSLCLNPTIAGTFTYSDVTNSAVQKATGATANTVSDEGLIIDSGYIRVTNQGGGSTERKFVTSLRIGSTIAGTQDELVLCVTPLAASADIHGSLTFRELL